MKIKFQLIESEHDTNGLCLVFLRYFYSRSNFRYFTSEKCKIVDSDIDKMKFKRSHTGWKNAKDVLSKLRSVLETSLHNFKLQGIIPTPQQLKQSVTPQSSKKEPILISSIIDHYDRCVFLAWGEAKGNKHGTMKGLETIRNHLAQFCTTNPVSIDGFTKEVYDKFIAWMMSNFEYHPNYIGCQTKHLKTVFSWCVN